MSAGLVSYPKISVITPSYNQGVFLERTLQSVIDQNYPATEHIVVDGGSTDESVSILRDFECHLHYWVSEPDRGQTHAVNKGLALATGEIVGWLNSDDVYYPGAFAHVVDEFQNNPNINFIYGMADHIDADDQVLEPYYTEEWSYKRLQQLCFICQPAVFFRRSVLSQYGLLDEDLNYCMDYEFWLRCGAKEDFHYLKEPLAGSRLYPENKTLGSKVPVNEEIVRMLKAKFGIVDKQWLVSLSLAQARQRINPGTSTFRKTLAFFYALALWQRNLWANNKTVFPSIPTDYLLRLPFLPPKLSARLKKHRVGASRTNYSSGKYR